MKLSQAIKAIEDGSDNVFSLNGYSEKIKSERALKAIAIGELLISLDGWEEIKPPRQWSDDEKKLIELFHWAKYFTRERNGDILLSELEPEWVEDTRESYWCIESGKFVVISCNEEVKMDITIKFEESPVYIGDLKGE